MYVSHETLAETSARLRKVLASATLHVMPSEYGFTECSVAEFPGHLIGSSLAIVRDDQVWSALVPAEQYHAERFVVFSFHFLDAQDNSGFVGWLASELKRELGTGVFVICGQNSARGGIFDYWGVPASLGKV